MFLSYVVSCSVNGSTLSNLQSVREGRVGVVSVVFVLGGIFFL